MFDNASLGHSLGFQLRMLQIESDARAHQALVPFDISPARVAAMIVIDAHPGCTQTALGDALSVNRASAMKIVNFLERRGLARREAGADLRANSIHLTSAGSAALSKMTEALRLADQPALTSLSATEAETLFICFQKMRASLGSCAT